MACLWGWGGRCCYPVKSIPGNIVTKANPLSLAFFLADCLTALELRYPRMCSKAQSILLMPKFCHLLVAVQSFSAGVGNWVADEVLYQAHLHPEQLVAKLGEQQLKELHDALKEVVRVAVEARADSDKFPQTWMFHHRWEGEVPWEWCENAKLASGKDAQRKGG